MDSLSSSGSFGSYPYDNLGMEFFSGSQIQADESVDSASAYDEMSSYGKNVSLSSEEDIVANSFFDFPNSFQKMETSQSLPLQGRVAAELPPDLAQSISVVPFPIVPSSHDVLSGDKPLEGLPNKKRKCITPMNPSRKKLKTESKSESEKIDEPQIDSKAKSRLAAQKFREIQKEKIGAAEERLEALKTRVGNLYRQYRPNSSIELELESFIEGNLGPDQTAEMEEFEQTLDKTLPADEQKRLRRKFKKKLFARNSRATKKSQSASLKNQQKFLESRIIEVISGEFKRLSEQNASLRQENANLKQENAMYRVFFARGNVHSEQNAYSQSYDPQGAHTPNSEQYSEAPTYS